LPAEFGNICYSLDEAYVKSVYWNLFGGGGVKLMKHFKGDTSYRNLGTYGLEKKLHVGHCPVPVLVFNVHDVKVAGCGYNDILITAYLILVGTCEKELMIFRMLGY
jgi:hypothetical protein